MFRVSDLISYNKCHAFTNSFPDHIHYQSQGRTCIQLAMLKINMLQVKSTSRFCKAHHPNTKRMMTAQQLYKTIHYVFMLGPDLLPGPFYTVSTAANRTLIRKLIRLLVLLTYLSINKINFTLIWAK